MLVRCGGHGGLATFLASTWFTILAIKPSQSMLIFETHPTLVADPCLIQNGYHSNDLRKILVWKRGMD